MIYDFLEIGTSDFEIGEEIIIGGDCLYGGVSFERDKRYLLVDPVDYYLQRLAAVGYKNDNILHCNAAITSYDGELTVWYVSDEKQKQYNLPYWVRGCNKINEKHPTVVSLLAQMNIHEDVWSYETIPCMTFSSLCSRYSISHIKNLKIDTEGHDHVILEGVIDSLRKKLINIDKIKYEYIPVFGNTEQLDRLRLSILDLYPIQKQLGDNFYLFSN